MDRKPGADAHKELIDELARVLYDPDTARALVLAADFPSADLPIFSVPRVFWSQVIRAAADGKLFGGVRALVDEVVKVYPANPIFTAYQSKESSASKGNASTVHLAHERSGLPDDPAYTRLDAGITDRTQEAITTDEVSALQAERSPTKPPAHEPSTRKESVTSGSVTSQPGLPRRVLLAVAIGAGVLLTLAAIVWNRTNTNPSYDSSTAPARLPSEHDDNICEELVKPAEELIFERLPGSRTGVPTSNPQALASALALLQNVVVGHPHCLRAQALLARAHLEQGNLDEASRAIDVIAEQETDDCEVDELRADLAERSGNRETALSYLEGAVAKCSNNAVLHYNLARLLGPDRLEEALAHIDKTLEMERVPHADHHSIRARILHDLGDNVAALAEIEQAIALAPPNHPHHAHRATEIAIDLGQLERAEQEARRACSTQAVDYIESTRQHELRTTIIHTCCDHLLSLLAENGRSEDIGSTLEKVALWNRGRGCMIGGCEWLKDQILCPTKPHNQEGAPLTWSDYETHLEEDLSICGEGVAGATSKGDENQDTRLIFDYLVPSNHIEARHSGVILLISSLRCGKDPAAFDEVSWKPIRSADITLIAERSDRFGGAALQHRLYSVPTLCKLSEYPISVKIEGMLKKELRLETESRKELCLDDDEVQPFDLRTFTCFASRDLPFASEWIELAPPPEACAAPSPEAWSIGKRSTNEQERSSFVPSHNVTEASLSTICIGRSPMACEQGQNSDTPEVLLAGKCALSSQYAARVLPERVEEATAIFRGQGFTGPFFDEHGRCALFLQE